MKQIGHVRISADACSISLEFSSAHRAASGLRFDFSPLYLEAFILIAASSCPTPSCNSRAMRLLSSILKFKETRGEFLFLDSFFGLLAHRDVSRHRKLRRRPIGVPKGAARTAAPR